MSFQGRLGQFLVSSLGSDAASDRVSEKCRNLAERTVMTVCNTVETLILSGVNNPRCGSVGPKIAGGSF